MVVFDSLSEIDHALTDDSIATPTLDELFSNGAHFTHAYTPCPEGSPARASLFTGLDPCVHGVWTNGVSLPDHQRTFPELLSQSGYINCLVGRWQMAGVSNWTTELVRPSTFAQIAWAHGALHRSRQNAYLSWLQKKSPKHYAQIFDSQPDADNTKITAEQNASMSELPDQLCFNYWVGERIGELLCEHSSSQPFLAIAGFSTESAMGAEPEPNCDSEVVSARALQQADAALQFIIDQIAEKNVADDTVIIVTAARGSAKLTSTSQAMGEQAIRVPLLIHRAGFDKKVIEQPVSTIDIAPSILDIAGIPVGTTMQGSSLINVLNGSAPPRAWAMSRLRRDVPGNSRNWQSALRKDNFKLIVSHGNPQNQIPTKYKLFDLNVDPEEKQDLAESAAHVDQLEVMIDFMIDARCALEDRTEPRIAEF